MRVVNDSTQAVRKNDEDGPFLEVEGSITAIMLPEETLELCALIDSPINYGVEIQDWITERIPRGWRGVADFNWEYEIDLEYNVLSLTVRDVES